MFIAQWEVSVALAMLLGVDRASVDTSAEHPGFGSSYGGHQVYVYIVGNPVTHGCSKLPRVSAVWLCAQLAVCMLVCRAVPLLFVLLCMCVCPVGARYLCSLRARHVSCHVSCHVS